MCAHSSCVHIIIHNVFLPPLPVLKFCLLQFSREASTVLSSCAAGKDVIFNQILKQLLTGEEVVEEDVMILPFEEPCEILHHSLTQLLLSTTLPSRVHLEGMEVTIAAVSKYPYLHCKMFSERVDVFVCVFCGGGGGGGGEGEGVRVVCAHVCTCECVHVCGEIPYLVFVQSIDASLAGEGSAICYACAAVLYAQAQCVCHVHVP